jgi:hypothetical protein
MMEGKKLGSYKKDFEVAMFFSSQNIVFPFLFVETIGAFLFLSSSLSLFSILSLSFFSMLHLFEDLGILIINEDKNTIQKFHFR